MTQDMSAAPSPSPDQPRKSRTWIIILVAAVVLCCLCVVVAWAAWTYGDSLVQWINQLSGSATY